MPNLSFSIDERGGTGGRTTVLRIRDDVRGIGDFIRELILEAAHEGELTAKILAPENKTDPFRNRGHTIADSIRVSERAYRPGGLGGGGSYEVELIADGRIAPHLEYVFGGTGHHVGKGNIKPTRGNVLVFKKQGEGYKMRFEVKGQAPQQEWWERATETMEEHIRTKVRSAGLGEAIRK
jgi:hypothetical protein